MVKHAKLKIENVSVHAPNYFMEISPQGNLSTFCFCHACLSFVHVFFISLVLQTYIKNKFMTNFTANVMQCLQISGIVVQGRSQKIFKGGGMEVFAHKGQGWGGSAIQVHFGLIF